MLLKFDSVLPLCQLAVMKEWQTASERSKSGEEVARLMLETFRFHNALLAAGDELTSEFGLTNARWQVLGAAHDAPRTVSAIARFMGLTRQSVQRTILRLVTDGFIELVDNPEHARARLVTFTDKGLSALQGLSEKQAAWVAGLAKDIPPANIRIGVGMMRGLIRRLEEAD